MEFEWNSNKATSDLAKHDVSFHEASTVFGDPLEFTFPLDPDIAAAFPSEEAVNEALRFVLKVVDDAKNLARHAD